MAVSRATRAHASVAMSNPHRARKENKRHVRPKATTAKAAHGRSTSTAKLGYIERNAKPPEPATPKPTPTPAMIDDTLKVFDRCY